MSSKLELTSADRLMSRAGKTFYRAARLLPKLVRRDVVLLYAFCRTVDDLADEPSQPLAKRREFLAVLAEALEHGNATEMRAAGWPFTARGTLAQAAAMLVEAARNDLDQQQPETVEDVLSYAFGVAGTVGVMMADVLQAAPEGYSAAVALGMAMQLSNICRDVAEDLHAGRVYLPKTWAAADEVRLALDHGNAACASRVHQATLHLLAVADDLYEIAYDGIWSLPWRVRWSILAAARCYREIGAQVGRDVSGSWRHRTVVSNGRKLWLIAEAGLRLLLPRFWRPKDSLWPIALGKGALQAGRALGLAS